MNFIMATKKNGIADGLRLDYSGGGYPPAPSVSKAVRDALPKLNLYPYEWYDELRDAIASYSGVKNENVLPTNGGDEAIGIITSIFGKKSLIPAPTYGQYEYIARAYGYSVRLKDCMPDGYNYKVAYTNQDLKWASLAWICNPNNPTGNIVSRKNIENFLQMAKGLLVVDEAHYEFCGKTVVDMVERHDNLAVIRTFSKAFGIAGLRLGYIIANKKLIERLNSSKQEFNVSRVSRDAGIAALKSLPYYRAQIKRTIAERDLTERFCRRLGIFAFESNGRFILLRFSSRKELYRVHRSLKADGITTFVSGDSEFSGLHGPYMRIAAGSSTQMRRFRSAIEKAVLLR